MTRASLFGTSALIVMMGALPALSQTVTGLDARNNTMENRTEGLMHLQAPDFRGRSSSDSPITVDGDNLGDHTATTNLSMSGFRVRNMANPVSDQDAATKWYVDQLAFEGSGGVTNNAWSHNATTNIEMNGYTVTNVRRPIFGGDVVNLSYFQENNSMGDHNASRDITMNRFRITGVGDPVDPGDVVNLSYLDQVISRLVQRIEGNTTLIEGNRTLIDETRIWVADNRTAISDNRVLIDDQRVMIDDNRTRIDQNFTSITELYDASQSLRFDLTQVDARLTTVANQVTTLVREENDENFFANTRIDQSTQINPTTNNVTRSGGTGGQLAMGGGSGSVNGAPGGTINVPDAPAAASLNMAVSDGPFVRTDAYSQVNANTGWMTDMSVEFGDQGEFRLVYDGKTGNAVLENLAASSMINLFGTSEAGDAIAMARFSPIEGSALFGLGGSLEVGTTGTTIEGDVFIRGSINGVDAVLTRSADVSPVDMDVLAAMASVELGVFETKDGNTSIGVSAKSLTGPLSYAVLTTQEGETLVDQAQLVASLIGAVQTLSARVESLEAQISSQALSEVEVRVDPDAAGTVLDEESPSEE